MNNEKLTSFNLHLAKRCRPSNKSSSNCDYKEFSLKYSLKSNSSTSSYLNSESDDLELDLDTENSNDTYLTSENALNFDSKFSDQESNLKTEENDLNDSNLFRTKLGKRQRFNQSVTKRKAANLRERKRMKSINYAFDVSLFDLNFEIKFSYHLFTWFNQLVNRPF